MNEGSRNVSALSAAALRAKTIIEIRIFSPDQCICCRKRTRACRCDSFKTEAADETASWPAMELELGQRPCKVLQINDDQSYWTVVQ